MCCCVFISEDKIFARVMCCISLSVFHRVITAWFLLNYAWANCTMLALGVWAVAQKDSLDAVVMVRLALRHVTTHCYMQHIVSAN